MVIDPAGIGDFYRDDVWGCMNKNLKMVDLPTLDDDGTVYDDHGNVVPGSVVTLHNAMINALRKAYPAFKDHWHIVVDTRGGIVQVRNMALSPDMGFVLHITKIDPEMRRVRTLAGELLERFNAARTQAIKIEKAMRDVKFNRIGQAQYED